MADATCDRSLINGTGAPWEVNWRAVDRTRCSCPSDLSMSATLASGEILRMPAKRCSLLLGQQRVQMQIMAPALDFPAYTAHEINKGTYGNLSRVLTKNLSAASPRLSPTWVDVGANLGLLSIAMALANPSASGVAYEPNPIVYAFLRHNIEANGLAGRVRAVNAGISSDGRQLVMPRCVVAQRTGSQMASTQWVNGRTSQLCFSPACHRKALDTAQCMKEDPRVVPVPSVTLSSALEAGVAMRGGAMLSTRASRAGLNLLKVDCEGCEHEIMDRIRDARESGAVLRVTGECHAIKNLTDAQKMDCLRELRGRDCKYGVTFYLTCKVNQKGPYR